MTRVGLQIASFTYPDVPDHQLFDRIAGIAVAGEEAGFDSVWVMDHFLQIPGGGTAAEPMLEAYTLLGALAARTSRARLGALVTGVTYRNPALLAKIVTTLDVVSGGRAMLGLGGAWFEAEHRAYGFEFPPGRERLHRLEEALQICRAMFTQHTPSFEGQRYSIHEALNVPRPLQPEGPRILVGGSGEQVTLRLVAEHADVCNLFGDVDTVRHKLEVLDRHCEAVGRDPRQITRTKLATLAIAPTAEEADRRREPLARQFGTTPDQLGDWAIVGGPDQVAEQVQELLDAGLDGVIVNLDETWDLDKVRLAGETLRAVVGG